MSKTPQILTLDFEEFRDTYQDGLTPTASLLQQGEELYQGFNPRARVLVAYVPQENALPYEQLKAAEYYTRPKFPNTINLKEVEYFVPYFKGKGIRDIYKVHHSTPKEYAEGHIAGAVNKDWKSERFAEEIGAYGTDERIVVYCARGVRSQKAAEMMSGMGFTQVFNLIGGFEVWKNAGKPIVKSVEYKEVKSHK